MSSIETLSDDELAVVVLGPLMAIYGRRIGGVRLAQVLIAAGLKLTADIEGEAAAWVSLRGALEVATERARQAAHGNLRPVE